MRLRLFALSLLAAASVQAAEPAPPTYGYRIVNTYPHDPRAFTQGLFYLNGNLYESTGQVGQSTIRKVHFEDGRVLQSVPIPPGLFGEGITNFGNEIISITWQGGNGYRWDLPTLRRTGEWHYEGEGWGLTQNGTDIIMSDGTSAIRFLDPATLAERRRITVTLQGNELVELNELEWVNGEIWANIWQTPLMRLRARNGSTRPCAPRSPLPCLHPWPCRSSRNPVPVSRNTWSPSPRNPRPRWSASGRSPSRRSPSCPDQSLTRVCRLLSRRRFVPCSRGARRPPRRPATSRRPG